MHLTLPPLETMDFGYPQNCAIDLLRLYVTLGTAKVSLLVSLDPIPTPIVRQKMAKKRMAASSLLKLLVWWIGDVKGFGTAKMRSTSMSTSLSTC